MPKVKSPLKKTEKRECFACGIPENKRTLVQVAYGIGTAWMCPDCLFD